MSSKSLDARYELVAWGIILILVGCLSVIPGNQGAVAVLGVGIVLLGLNVARYASGIAVSPFSVVLGVLAVSLGAVVLLRPVFGWDFHFDIPAFPAALIVVGLYLLLPSRKRLERV